MAHSIDVKVLAGDLLQGKQRILLNSIKSAELQTEDKLKKLAGSAGWSFAGALVGGLLTGGIGLAVGGLAGILSGGNKTEVCFSCELEDGQRFLAITSKKTWQSILAAKFVKDQVQISIQSQQISDPQVKDQVESRVNELELPIENKVVNKVGSDQSQNIKKIEWPRNMRPIHKFMIGLSGLCIIAFFVFPKESYSTKPLVDEKQTFEELYVQYYITCTNLQRKDLDQCISERLNNHTWEERR
ncbi:hypothetical protein [Altericista sp. CCNU0014]|uniref:hypothetical protein n=1 Tax=Altericista sp. CCNU0014 TaxID=3082949 RepID=UPI00384ACD34